MQKKILAVIAIILLISMYGITIVFALIDNPKTMHLLGASVGLTILVPVIIWVFMMFFKNRD